VLDAGARVRAIVRNSASWYTPLMSTGGDLPEGRAPAAGAATPGAAGRAKARESDEHLPAGRRRRRLAIERLLIRLISTVGIVGVGVAIGAIMRSSGDEGWLIGLVVAAVTLILSVVMRWAARRL
jgi:hypothetical protein